MGRITMGNNREAKLLSISLIIVLLTAGLPIMFELGSENGSVEASNTIIVDAAGGANYTTIQAAIDNATVGDTIRVWTGVYNEHITINKSLTLLGNDTQDTTIDGSFGLERFVVSVSANSVTISDFSIIYSGYSSIGGGFELNKVKDCKIKNNIISLNKEYGIYLYSSSGNIIQNNECLNNEHGIYLDDSKGNKINNNQCSSNSYGISQFNSKDNSIINNNVSSNKQVGINLLNSFNDTIIDNRCFLNNIGIWLGRSSKCLINNNTYSTNSIGIDLFYSSTTTLLNNTCNLNDKVGIKFHYSDRNLVLNNTCQFNNRAGIEIFNSFNNTINNNKNSNNSKGIIIIGSFRNIFQNNSYEFNNYNGVILIDSSFNTFKNNYIFNNEDTGMIFNNSSNNTVTSCYIKNNFQGIVIEGLSNTTIINCFFSNNTIFGVNNTVSHNIINATYNHWGDQTGPHDPDDDRAIGGWYNPNGLGDNVTNYVNYKPWLGFKNIPPEIDGTDLIEIIVNTKYEVVYDAQDPNYDQLKWTYISNASWLTWGQKNHTLYGKPSISDIGEYWVRINISDGYGGFDGHLFNIEVIKSTEKPVDDGENNTDRDSTGFIITIIVFIVILIIVLIFLLMMKLKITRK
jgi:parallel beta-helix repeat protein